MKEQFEQAIFENPQDASNFAVYADWLQEQGDPRGEFIQFQLSLEDRKRPKEERDALRGREAALLDEHAWEWLGSLASLLLQQDEATGKIEKRRGFDFWFTRGWLGTIRTERLYPRVAERIAEAPEARLLDTLIIGRNGDEACSTLENLDLVSRLIELDLSRTQMTNSGVWALLRCEGVRDLKYLDVSDNLILPNGIEALLNQVPHASVDDQVEAEEDDDEHFDGIRE